MPYPYPKYTNHPDARAHVKQFRSIWAVNHGIQGLSAANAEQSKIVEFQLSLEGQAARWYSQQDITSFQTFDELAAKFEELFQVKLDPTEVLREYYSLKQQPTESVADFLIRFQAVEGLLDTPPTEDIRKRQFLKALKEPLRSSFALLDFTTVPVTEVINRALNLDHQNIGTGLALFQGLTASTSQPTAEETQFRQAIQCTRCLQFGHSNVECTQQCALCQSRTHGTATCEYNLLARRNGPQVQALEAIPDRRQQPGPNRGPQDVRRFDNQPRYGNQGRQEPRRNDQRRDDYQDRQDNYRREQAGRNNDQGYQQREYGPPERRNWQRNNGPRNPRYTRRFQQPREGGFPIVCHRCMQNGHLARDCPHPPPQGQPERPQQQQQQQQ